MKIMNVLNNSALIAQNEHHEEYVLIGKGISFQKRPGDSVDMSKVEKKFSKETKTASGLRELLPSVPDAYINAASSIIRYANKKMPETLNSGIYLTLLDHINSSMERYEEGIHLDFNLNHEFRLLYAKEFAIAQWALDYLNATLDVDLPESELGFIVVHLLNASTSEGNMTKTRKVMRMTSEIADLVKSIYPDIDEEGMDYARFLSHLKYFALRYFEKNQLEEHTLRFILPKEEQKELQPCIETLDAHLLKKYKAAMKEDEKMYLMLHLLRLIRS